MTDPALQVPGTPLDVALLWLFTAAVWLALAVAAGKFAGYLLGKMRRRSG